MKHIYRPIKGLQDLIDMVNTQDNTDISALFNTAYIRGYGQGCEDTKKHITLIINANNN